ncbi:hypothetical protein NKR19_g7475 [Coniochaeta hoffmannii]|uniref:Uncharacterized protein n=1 Tax=Coniochaeta hoffmannii TaxID=91930 RepID=A0AA38RS43_9PEZI|nr:hypothetical protein NKR19_g7475 [Coniochaeta hoffmannii]
MPHRSSSFTFTIQRADMSPPTASASTLAPADLPTTSTEIFHLILKLSKASIVPQYRDVNGKMFFRKSTLADIQRRLSLPDLTSKELSEVVLFGHANGLYKNGVWDEAVLRCDSLHELKVLVRCRTDGDGNKGALVRVSHEPDEVTGDNTETRNGAEEHGETGVGAGTSTAHAEEAMITRRQILRRRRTLCGIGYWREDEIQTFEESTAASSPSSDSQNTTRDRRLRLTPCRICRYLLYLLLSLIGVLLVILAMLSSTNLSSNRAHPSSPPPQTSIRPPPGFSVSSMDYPPVPTTTHDPLDVSPSALEGLLNSSLAEIPSLASLFSAGSGSIEALLSALPTVPKHLATLRAKLATLPHPDTLLNSARALSQLAGDIASIRVAVAQLISSTNSLLEEVDQLFRLPKTSSKPNFLPSFLGRIFWFRLGGSGSATRAGTGFDPRPDLRSSAQSLRGKHTALKARITGLSRALQGLTRVLEHECRNVGRYENEQLGYFGLGLVGRRECVTFLAEEDVITAEEGGKRSFDDGDGGWSDDTDHACDHKSGKRRGSKAGGERRKDTEKRSGVANESKAEEKTDDGGRVEDTDTISMVKASIGLCQSLCNDLAVVIHGPAGLRVELEGLRDEVERIEGNIGQVEGMMEQLGA